MAGFLVVDRLGGLKTGSLVTGGDMKIRIGYNHGATGVEEIDLDGRAVRTIINGKEVIFYIDQDKIRIYSDASIKIIPQRKFSEGLTT